ncbi:MAG: hypothetical protein R8G66_02470 [Cytophagales bacterium]|nr:hypothetical protein [Cytophagales bacterium]
MSTKQLRNISFAITFLCTLFFVSCTDEEELPSLIGRWEVNTISADAEFDEDVFLNFLEGQGFAQMMSNELLEEYKAGLVEVEDLNEVITTYEFRNDGTYMIRTEFINGDFPDQEESGTYLLNDKSNELTFIPMVSSGIESSFTFMIDSFSETDLVLSGSSEEVTNYGLNGGGIQIAFTVNYSIAMTRLQ